MLCQLCDLISRNCASPLLRTTVGTDFSELYKGQHRVIGFELIETF